MRSMSVVDGDGNDLYRSEERTVSGGDLDSQKATTVNVRARRAQVTRETVGHAETADALAEVDAEEFSPVTASYTVKDY